MYLTAMRGMPFLKRTEDKHIEKGRTMAYSKEMLSTEARVVRLLSLFCDKIPLSERLTEVDIWGIIETANYLKRGKTNER